MTPQIIEIRDANRWNAALETLPEAHVLQSWEWGEFKARWGWQVSRLLFEQDGQPVAAAQLLQRRLSRTPFSVLYVPKGPTLDYQDSSLLAVVLSTLEQEARRRRSLFVKLDPDVYVGVETQEEPIDSTAAEVQAILAARGWLESQENIQFKNTVIVDLGPDEEELLSRMKSKTRYNIRLAERRGVRIRVGNETHLEVFYRLYHETAQRDGFIIRPFAYYRDVWSQFMHRRLAYLLMAEVDGSPIAGLMMFVFARKAWYMYGASSTSQRNLMPNHLLQWEVMRLARQLGCTHYDMWGAPNTLTPDDPMWGVYRFKTGFGGQTARGIGAYDYPPHHTLYMGYSGLMPRILNLMRRRHRAASPE